MLMIKFTEEGAKTKNPFHNIRKILRAKPKVFIFTQGTLKILMNKKLILILLIHKLMKHNFN